MIVFIEKVFLNNLACAYKPSLWIEGSMLAIKNLDDIALSQALKKMPKRLDFKKVYALSLEIIFKWQAKKYYSYICSPSKNTEERLAYFAEYLLSYNYSHDYYNCSGDHFSYKHSESEIARRVEDCLRELKNAGLDFDKAWGLSLHGAKESYLARACRRGKLDQVQLLLSIGARPDVKGFCGKSCNKLLKEASVYMGHSKEKAINLVEKIEALVQLNELEKVCVLDVKSSSEKRGKTRL